MKDKGFPVFKGSPEYWQVLDSSFDINTRRQIQATVKSNLLVTDKHYTLEELADEREPVLHHKQEYIPVVSETKFVE